MSLEICADGSASLLSDDGQRMIRLPAYDPRTMQPWRSEADIEACALALAANPDAWSPVVVEPAAVCFEVTGGILARFGATSPVEARELVGFTAVSRIAKGRYRCLFSDDLGTDQYCVTPSVMDSVVRTVRYTARTSAYCEVKVVDQAGAAADAAEVIVEVKRVFQS